MADVEILASQVSPAPLTYSVPGGQEILLKCLAASFDGSGAGSSWQPAVQLIGPSGRVLRTFPLAPALAAGASADVSWFPGIGAAMSTPAVGGSFVLLKTITLAAPQQTIDFTAIDQTYKHLHMICRLRSTVAADYAGASWTFNSLTGAGSNYEYADSLGNTAINTIGQTVAECLGASADTGHFADSVVSVPDYSNSEEDHAAHSYSWSISRTANTATWRTILRGMQFCGAAPITITQITIDAGAGNNFVTGSSVSMYGLTG